MTRMSADHGSSGLRQAGALASIGTMMVSCTLVGLAAGYWLDKWLGTDPWLLIIFLLIGIVSGFVSMIQTASRQRQPTRESFRKGQGTAKPLADAADRASERP